LATHALQVVNVLIAARIMVAKATAAAHRRRGPPKESQGSMHPFGEGFALAAFRSYEQLPFELDEVFGRQILRTFCYYRF